MCLEDRFNILIDRYTTPNEGFNALHKLSTMKREQGDRTVKMLDRIETIGREGSIAENSGDVGSY